MPGGTGTTGGAGAGTMGFGVTIGSGVTGFGVYVVLEGVPVVAGFISDM
jgi:hypothetical protein